MPRPTDTRTFIKRSEPDQFGTSETHPSYGTIGISQVSGHTHLFDSDVDHQHFIRITIRAGSLDRDGVIQRIMGHETLAEVDMSAAQFAEFITSPNRGTGIPCTLKHIKGDPTYGPGYEHWRPPAPEPESFLSRFKEEALERANLMDDHLTYAKTLVDAMVDGEAKLNKTGLREIQSKLASALMEINANMPWVLKQLNEQMEEKLQRAATEFEGYVGMRLKDMGLTALQGQTPTLRQLPEMIQKSLTDGADGGILKSEPVMVAEPVTEED